MAASNEINLQNLNIQQLDALKNQLQNELRQFTTSFQGLKQAQSRFQGSKTAVESLVPENEGKSVYIPLTSSMYVPAHLTNVDNVLVDVGTGYYVSKSSEEAKSFMDRKIAFLQQNTTSLQQVMAQKRENLELVIGFMQQKLKTTSQ